MRPRANQKETGGCCAVRCVALRCVALRCVPLRFVRNLPVDSASGQRNKSLTISTDPPSSRGVRLKVLALVDPCLARYLYYR